MHKLKCAALWKWWMKVAKPTSLQLLTSIFLKQQTSSEANGRAKQNRPALVCVLRQKNDNHPRSSRSLLYTTDVTSSLLPLFFSWRSFPGVSAQGFFNHPALKETPQSSQPSASSGAPHMAPACPPWSAQFLMKPLQRCEAPHPSPSCGSKSFLVCLLYNVQRMFSLDELQ